MTCKDCKKWEKCKHSLKSDKYAEDGDSWANWCMNFDTIHKGKSISKSRYKEISEEELEAYLDAFRSGMEVVADDPQQ